jgi:FkbM family methyltransferase
MKAMFQSAAKLFYPRGSVRTVWRGSRSGCRFVVRDAMGVMFALGKADEDVCGIYRSLIAPGDTVFDIGANRGQMSLLFSRLVGRNGTVVAIEPVPDVVQDLERNCQLNQLNNVKVICAAAAASIGEQVFTFPSSRQTQGKLASVEPSYENESSESFRVATVTLDSLVKDLGRVPSFLKVDVEGAAGVVFSGAQELLTKGRPRIYLELHGPEEQAAARDLAVIYHYEITTLDGEPVPDPTAAWKCPLLCRPGR